MEIIDFVFSQETRHRRLDIPHQGVYFGIIPKHSHVGQDIKETTPPFKRANARQGFPE